MTGFKIGDVVRLKEEFLRDPPPILKIRRTILKIRRKIGVNLDSCFRVKDVKFPDDSGKPLIFALSGWEVFQPAYMWEKAPYTLLAYGDKVVRRNDRMRHPWTNLCNKYTQDLLGIYTVSYSARNSQIIQLREFPANVFREGGGFYVGNFRRIDTDSELNLSDWM